MKAANKVAITEEKILEASWILLGRSGIEEFSMRKLADQLNVKAASLYWHFESKQSIFQALVNQVSKEILKNIKLEGTWNEQLFNAGVNFRNSFKKFPCSAHIFMKTLPSEPEYLKLMNKMLSIIEHANISDVFKFSYIMSLINYVISFEVDAYEQQRNAREVVNFKDLFKQKLESLDTSESNIMLRMYDHKVMEALSSDRMFEHGLNIIILGIQQLIPE